MGLFLTMIILFTFTYNIEANWKLKWTDEFDQDVIDLEKWEIDEQDIDTCDPQKIGRFNCFTNSTKNLRLINGTLSLVAIYENRFDKKYTSAWIKTAKNFTYGRIDMRAALPVAKLLSPWIKLVAPEAKNIDGFIRDNQVIVFYDDQTNFLRYGVPLGKKVGEFEVNGALNHFHTYSIEWNETDLIWKFDGIQTNRIDLIGIKSFLNNPVILTIYLRVGGIPYKNAELTLEEVFDWDCSLLTIEYVRYYQWTDEEEVHSNQSEAIERSSVDFCKNVMDEIRPEKAKLAKSYTMTIISIILLALLLALIGLITWLVFRMKKMKPARNVDDTDGYYDDVNNMEMYDYEEVNKDNNYEYVEHYRVIDHDNANYYAEPELVAIPELDLNDKNNDYITMTSKVKPPHEYTPIVS